MFFMFYILLQLCKFLKTLHTTPRVTYIEKEIKLNFCTPKQVHAHYNRSLNFILSLNVITSVRVDAIVIKQRRLFSNPQMIPKSMNCHILCLPRVPYFTNAMSLSIINIILILIYILSLNVITFVKTSSEDTTLYSTVFIRNLAFLSNFLYLIVRDMGSYGITYFKP